MSEEQTELGETLAEGLREAMQELEIRRQAVLLEVLAKVREIAEKREEATPNQVLLRGMRDGDIHVDAAEHHMLVHGAELIATLVEVALLRGAGVLAGSPEVPEVPPYEPGVTGQPPATAESLG